MALIKDRDDGIVGFQVGFGMAGQMNNAASA
jgi:hypothetical protein